MFFILLGLAVKIVLFNISVKLIIFLLKVMVLGWFGVVEVQMKVILGGFEDLHF